MMRAKLVYLFKPFLLFLLITVLAPSCSIERKVAKQFVNDANRNTVMLLFPDQVFLVNSKKADKQPAFFFDDIQYDSTLIDETIVFAELDNDELLKAFKLSMTSELNNYGFKVFPESEMENFLMQDSNLFMVDVVQIELQEFTTLIEDAINVGEIIYTKDIWLNGLNMAVWIELNAANNKTFSQPRLLFAENNLYDRYDGFFTQRFLTGDIDYRLTIDTITANDAMVFIQYLGRLYAAYTFDFLMNHNIERAIPEVQRSGKYFRYDPYRKMFFNTDTDRFILLD